MAEVRFPGSEVIVTLPKLDFKQNDFVWIKGNSGVGKSTLFLILKGIIPKYIYAEVSGDLPELLEDAAYLFQNPHSQIVSPFVTEELAFSMENMRLDSALMKHRIEEAGKLLEVNHAAKNTADLSSGECQRLVLASMLAAKPKVLLLDEPTAFLDMDARERFYGILRKLQGKHTILLIDHNYKEELGLHNKVYEFQDKHQQEINSNFQFAPLGTEVEVSINNLFFKYSKQEKLIENFNFHARGGEIIAVLGKNGVGKSTLLKLIAELIKPQSGTLRVYGKLSFVFQNPESHFYFDTVREELPACSEAWIKYFGLTSELDQSPFSLSEGQKRRLNLLMAILENRPIILYDEPTFGQDLGNIEKICQVMQKLKQQGRLQIIVTHDHELAARLCDRIYYLN